LIRRGYKLPKGLFANDKKIKENLIKIDLKILMLFLY